MNILSVETDVNRESSKISFVTVFTHGLIVLI